MAQEPIRVRMFFSGPVLALGVFLHPSACSSALENSKPESVDFPLERILSYLVDRTWQQWDV